MKKLFRYPIIFLCLFGCLAGNAQFVPKNGCEVKNGRICFQLDRRWTAVQRKDVSVLFSLDSTLIANALAEMPIKTNDSIDWKTEKLNDNIIELSKPVGSGSTAYHQNDVMMVDENWFHAPPFNIPEIPPIPGVKDVFFFDQSVNYGLNNFMQENVFRYKDGMATFFLPGYSNTKQVYLSGSFNNWSTMQMPMQKTDTGWLLSLKLEPGKHLYKFITDGIWIHDLLNNLKENDGNNGYNSVVYCYNYCFRLKGFPDARKVIVSGSFNGWNKKRLKMYRAQDSWMLPIYLREGTHAYKFIVDKQWMVDPDNKHIRPDGSGQYNSFLGIGDTVVFRLRGFTSAEKVALAGDFNAWNPGELFMDKTPVGWELPYALGAGNYEYKFIVDGMWIPDPDNPLTRGTGEFQNSIFTNKPNHSFLLKGFADAQRVIVTGSFNGWQTDNYLMVKKEGAWMYALFLKPGKYTYKFIVDGNWILDPANDQWDDNAEGTGNSVLWIE